MKETKLNPRIAELVANVNELPFEDQLNFMTKFFANKKPIMLSSGCSSIAYGIFHYEMAIAGLPITEKTNAKIKYLGELQTRMWDLNKALYEFSKAETKEKYGV
jgi:hypothetical protein